MFVIAWIFLGLLSGYVASRVVHDRGREVAIELVLGVIGALIGGAMFYFAAQIGGSGLNVWSVLVSVVAAAALLFVYHALPAPRSRA